MCVPDVNKRGSPPVARPGGPAILAGMICGCIPLMWYDGGWIIPAMVLTVSAAFVTGYVDDRRVMSGWFKPLALCLAALPLLLVGGYDTALEFSAVWGRPDTRAVCRGHIGNNLDHWQYCKLHRRDERGSQRVCGHGDGGCLRGSGHAGSLGGASAGDGLGGRVPGLLQVSPNSQQDISRRLGGARIGRIVRVSGHIRRGGSGGRGGPPAGRGPTRFCFCPAYAA